MNPSKFRSPYRDLDLKLLRSLCNLHPWPMLEICKFLGIGRSVLTNVFSGQRPIPTRVAQNFLDFVGMRYDGSLDPNHVFILKEKPGNEAELADLLARIFPINPASTVTLVASRINESCEATSFKSKHGLIYFDGLYAAVVHNSDKKTEPVIRENNRWKLIDSGPSDNLLSTHPLPTKLDVLRTVSGSNFPIKITWKQVEDASKAKGMDAAHVLQLINSAPSIYKSVW